MLKIVAAATAACFVASVAAVPSDPEAAAPALMNVAKMTLDETVTLLHGGRAPAPAACNASSFPTDVTGVACLRTERPFERLSDSFRVPAL